MKVLLVYPTTTTNGTPDKFKKALIPPLNLAILSRLTKLADHKHQVTVINEYVQDIDFDSKWDLVGITALTSQVVRAYQIADRFMQTGAKVVLGGVHPSLLTEEASQYANSIVVGEAENIWAEVLADAEAGRLKSIYQDSSFPDLKNLILPDWTGFDLSVYRRSIGNRMCRLPIYTTRGCLYGCSFCSVSKFFGRSYRCRPISNVLNEIKAVPAERYFFTDDNIVCRPSYSADLFKALTTVGRKITWFGQSSTTILKTPDLIPQAAKAGCTALFFGVESINSNNLTAVNKKFNDPIKYVEIARRCYREGIKPWFSFIFGFDGESLDAMAETVFFLKKNQIWNVIFWILTPLPGTALWDEMKSAGRINNYDWSKYDLNHVVYIPDMTSADDLQDNFWKIFRAMYSIGTILPRAFYAQKISKRGFVNSLLNQYYFNQQIQNRNHPYSMGIWKTN
jgi:radical SAM superfamily enzyme YgiQ (UPF0313 family)